MRRLVLKNNTEVFCDVIVRPANYQNVLHIYTHSITPIQAYQIFSDPEATKEIRVIKIADDGQDQVEENVYYNFTDLFSVQKARFFKVAENEILIWMQYPEPNYNNTEGS